MDKRVLLQKSFSIFTGLSLVLQSLLPGLSVLATPAYAQEVPPATVEQSVSPTDAPAPVETSTTVDSITPTDAPSVVTDTPTPVEVSPTEAVPTEAPGCDGCAY